MGPTESPMRQHQMEMETASLGHPTVYAAGLRSTPTDPGEDQIHCVGDAGNGESVDTNCPSSTSSADDGPFLRGGGALGSPEATQAQGTTVGADGQAASGTEEDDIDYEDLDDILDDDGYSTSSDWDNYGDLPLTMDTYNELVARLEGSEDWNAEQRKLHKLIYMRGLHPMMPSWWRVSFRMWGVTQPHLDDVFTPKHSKKRVAIHAYGNEVAAAKALEALFYLSQTVADYEEIGYEHLISSTVAKGIRNYIRWALRDAGIDGSKTQLNMLVQEYSPNFRGDGEYESIESDFSPSVTSGDENGDAAGTGGGGGGDDRGDDGLTEAQRQRRFTRAVSRDLEKRLLDMGQRWRRLLRDDDGRGYIAQPPTLYAFAIVQHIVMLASHDSGASTNPVVVLEQVRLNDRGQWLWNALSIALPVNIARDTLYRMWDTGVIVPEQEKPDLDL